VLQWFRKRARDAETAPEAPPPALEEGRPEPEGSGPADPARPRRRRGSRGGRGRKKTGAAAKPAEAGDEKKQSAKEKDAPERKPARSRSRSRTKDADADKSKRRRAPRRTSSGGTRAALAGVKKEILVSVGVTEQRVAVLEDDKPSEVYLERPGHRSIAGNIYKGVVDNVLPGMEASFVDIGLDRNGFLYVDEIVVPELEGKRHGRRIQELVQRGQEVLVQAVKDPMGTKGARLTTEISLPGRFLVYTPFGEGIGISRRLEDAERDRLKSISKKLELPEGGIIIRTAAEGATEEELSGDLELLRRLWETIQARAGNAKPPTLVYQEAELPLRIVRDLFIRDFERVVVDHDRTYRRIVGYLRKTSRDLADRVELYGGREPLMEAAGVEEAVRSTLDRRVNLPSGGYLIFDYAEAFTVVDVNTGRFVGARGKTSGARLEDTITKNNLEAVTEVVRQLRLRDIGGIIVIDFIDMANPKNRELVEEALKNELEKDRTKTYVVEISPLGLVEMTRQNVTDGPREILTVACPTCSGDGIVVSHETHAVDVERKLRELVTTSRNQAYEVEVHAHAAAIVVGPGASRLAEIEEETGRRFFLKAREDVPGDHFAVLARGPVSRLQPKSLPLAEGSEIRVRLEERDPHSPGDGLGKSNGLRVAVAGGGSLLGKTVKATVARVLGDVAYAVLAGGDAAEPPVEAGTELDRTEPVETPKRRSRSRRRPKAAEPAKDATATEEPAEADTDADAVAVPDEPEADGAQPAPEKPKRKTRRGSRGGRGRKKTQAPTAAANGGEPDAAQAAEAVAASEPAADAVAEPASPNGAEAASTEGGEEQPKPKRKTRRGSRGGRNRKRKKPAGAEGEAATSAGDGGRPAEAGSVAASEESG
jgi:ribonuclease G